MSRIAPILSLVLIMLAACTRANPAAPARPGLGAGDYSRSLVSGGRERSYLVHLPPAISQPKKFALVIVLHGGGGSGQGAARMTGMSNKADKEEFIVVYPDGTGRLGDRLLTWNSGNCCGYALDNQVDDVGFVRALVDEMQSAYPIDPKRIYATGISNGGMMSYRLACEMSDKIAAIAPVAGALNTDCKPTQPVSVIAFHGTGDQNVLFDGGAPQRQADRHSRVDQSVSYAMNFWSKQDGCSPTPQRTEKGNIVRAEYVGCVQGTGIVLYAIRGGGHAWPGGEPGSPLGDAPTKEVSATDLMWEFFKGHGKQ